MGFKGVSNDLFAENSWYFRNALVRAAATNVSEGVYPDRIYIDRFFGNLLLGEKNILRNRELHINAEKNAVVSDTVKPRSDTVNDTANDTVFEWIKKDPYVTAEELAARTGLSIATVKRHIKRLKDGGKIVRAGSDKAGSWKISK